MSVKIPYHFQYFPMDRGSNRCQLGPTNNKPRPIKLTHATFLTLQSLFRVLTRNPLKPLLQLTHTLNNISLHTLFNHVTIACKSLYPDKSTPARFHQPRKNLTLTVMDSASLKQCRQSIGMSNNTKVKPVKTRLLNSQTDKVSSDHLQHQHNIGIRQHAQIVRYHSLSAIKKTNRIFHADAYPGRNPARSPALAVSIVFWQQCKPNSAKEDLADYHRSLNLYKIIIKQAIHRDELLHPRAASKENNLMYTKKHRQKNKMMLV